MLAVTITSVAIVALFLAAMIVIGFGFYAKSAPDRLVNYAVGAAEFALGSFISAHSHQHSVHVAGAIAGGFASMVVLGIWLGKLRIPGDPEDERATANTAG